MSIMVHMPTICGLFGLSRLHVTTILVCSYARTVRMLTASMLVSHSIASNRHVMIYTAFAGRRR